MAPAVDNLDDNEGHTTIHRRHPEDSAATQLGDEGGEIGHAASITG